MTARKNVLVTGAATGIGRAIALKFARNGYRVGAYDINLGGLEALVTDAGSGTEVVTGALDVRDPEQWALVLEQFVGPDGQLDVLVNNAGILQDGAFAQLPLADQTRTVEVNVIGLLNGCHTAFPYLKRTRGAQVINLCSASAIYGQPKLATYSATKFAVRGITEALDLEWADDDITVTALWPLFVATDMTATMDVGPMNALGVKLTPQDVAQAAFDVVQPKGRKGVHRGVGVQSKVMMAAANLSPSTANRLVNKFLAGR